MSSLHVFTHDSDIFSSPNSSTLPPVPPFKLLSAECDPAEAQVLCWASNLYPQLAFVPSRPRFDSPLFKRLDCKLSIVEAGHLYQLDPEFQESWYRLEANLKLMADTLMADG